MQFQSSTLKLHDLFIYLSEFHRTASGDEIDIVLKKGRRE